MPQAENTCITNKLHTVSKAHGRPTCEDATDSGLGRYAMDLRQSRLPAGMLLHAEYALGVATVARV